MCLCVFDMDVCIAVYVLYVLYVLYVCYVCRYICTSVGMCVCVCVYVHVCVCVCVCKLLFHCFTLSTLVFAGLCMTCDTVVDRSDSRHGEHYRCGYGYEHAQYTLRRIRCDANAAAICNTTIRMYACC